MTELENKIGYKFNNQKLLKIALTHSSYANESAGRFESYERLEFLGDSILGMVTSDYIFKNYPQYPEGDLTKLRSSLVCEKQLCIFSKELKKSMDYSEHGGAPLMGISKPVFKAHGSSDAKTFKNAIRLAGEYVKRNVVELISKSLEEYNSSESEK